MLPDLHFAGKRQIATAHEKVSDALRVLQGISASTAGVDLMNVRKKQLDKVNAVLSDYVFGWWKKDTSSESPVWKSQDHSLAIDADGFLPAAADGLLVLGATDGQIADSIDLVARVQAALANEEAFEEAFEKQGVFSEIPKEIYDPNSKAGKPLASVWDAPSTSVLLSVAHTDYTYLGSWRWRWSPHATHQSEGGIDARAEAYYEQPWENDVFAYSTLPQTEFEGVDDSRYPREATLSYEGETVAQITGNFLKGTAWAQVKWEADAIGSSRIRRLELRGLENDGFGPLKLFGWGDEGYKDYASKAATGFRAEDRKTWTTEASGWTDRSPTGDTWRLLHTEAGKVDTDAGHVVEKIVFTDIPITHEKASGLVGFANQEQWRRSKKSNFHEGLWDETTVQSIEIVGDAKELSAHLLIAKKNGSTQVVRPVYTGRDASTEDIDSHSYAVEGRFVGQDLSGGRGPQGLIGRFELTVENSSVSNGNSQGTIKGAFGLELP